jgi:ATP-dependent DNA helicase RecG
LQSHQLLPIHEALQLIHQPADDESLASARRRFVFQELLVLQLALAIRRWNRIQRSRAPALAVSAKIHSRITRLFPFQLTAEQKLAIEEISQDMGQEVPMNRLLQGDVGSGKTAVAEYALLLTVAHGWQAVLMAPTEILALQHARTFERDLKDSRVRMTLLTGSLSAGDRRQRLAQIAAGEIDLVIGTHAVAQEAVEFSKLGLVIIDEQHKFGVRQRAVLKQAGLDPHYLVMTATPIPRTVAMTLFGDLDISTIRQGPHQQSIHTYCEPAEKSEQWWDFYRKKLREGRQGYVISPLVEQSEHHDLASVEECFEGLSNGQLSDFRLGLVHGRLPAREKEKVMLDFAEGKIQVLVATSVVEVGVDVPNATLMTIVGGQQFGLAQLHQLRGRIGRGKHTGYVCVFAQPANPEAEKRLEAFVEMTDGFELAEVDFALRGPGELFGFRQHGMPPLHIADLTRDMELLIEARTVAQQTIDADPGLADPELAKLRQMVLSRYGKSLDLGDVG